MKSWHIQKIKGQLQCNGMVFLALTQHHNSGTEKEIEIFSATWLFRKCIQPWGADSSLTVFKSVGDFCFAREVFCLFSSLSLCGLGVVIRFCCCFVSVSWRPTNSPVSEWCPRDSGVGEPIRGDCCFRGESHPDNTVKTTMGWLWPHALTPAGHLQIMFCIFYLNHAEEFRAKGFSLSWTWFHLWRTQQHLLFII